MRSFGTLSVVVGYRPYLAPSSTLAFEGLLVTPRGYAAKYGWDGAPRRGERPGAPLQEEERP